MVSVAGRDPNCRGRVTRVGAEVWFCAVVLAIACGLRVGWILTVRSVPVYDFWSYHHHAINVLTGHGYSYKGSPSVCWPPLYPFFLAGLYSVFGESLLAARIANVILQMLSIVLTYLLCRMTLGVAASRWASVLLAVSPQQIAYSGLLASENLFMPVLLGAALLMARVTSALHEKRRWLTPALLAGVLVGISALVRPVGLVLLIGAPLTWLLLRVRLRAAAGAALVTGLLAAATISPWTIRNWIVMHSFIPLSGGFAEAFWMGANPSTTGKWMPPDPVLFAGMTRPERLRAHVREGLRFIAQHPLTWLGYAPGKLRYLMGHYGTPFWWSVKSVEREVPEFLDMRSYRFNVLDADYNFYIALLILAIAGLVPTLRSRPLGTLAVVTLGVWVLSHVALIGAERYRLPMDPWFAMLAGSGASCAVGWMRRVTRRRFRTNRI